MTMIKICGIKTVSDAMKALEAGADYLGFNFYSKSVRFIDPVNCANISREVKKEYPHAKMVGVFVNSSASDILEILDTCQLDMAQLHGDESPEMFVQLRPRAFRAFRGMPANIAGYERSEAPAFLLDAFVKDSYGGSGVRADWIMAERLAEKYPILLAGGLTPENVAEAIQQVKPWGVDVASGIESAPGRKDAGKMSAFVQAVRAGL